MRADCAQSRGRLAGAFAQLAAGRTSPRALSRGGQNSAKTPKIIYIGPRDLAYPGLVGDRSPPRSGLVSPRAARIAAWVLIGSGLAVLVLTPSGRHWWTLAAALLIWTGLGAGWRAGQG